MLQKTIDMQQALGKVHELRAYRVCGEGCRLVVKALLDTQLPLQAQHH